MIVGFNHNVTYRGTAFHVQTEDSGLQKPQLVTLLYHSGTIIASQKTVYADIVKVDNLDQVVEELAKEQHKGMLRRLTKGEFDKRIVELGIPLGAQTSQPAAQPEISDKAPTSSPAGSTSQSPTGKDVGPGSAAVKIVSEPVVDKFRKPKEAPEQSLDEVIYAYLTAGQSQD